MHFPAEPQHTYGAHLQTTSALSYNVVYFILIALLSRKLAVQRAIITDAQLCAVTTMLATQIEFWHRRVKSLIPPYSISIQHSGKLHWWLYIFILALFLHLTSGCSLWQLQAPCEQTINSICVYWHCSMDSVHILDKGFSFWQLWISIIIYSAPKKPTGYTSVFTFFIWLLRIFNLNLYDKNVLIWLTRMYGYNRLVLI